ncbi:hypothetical protein [Paucibacter sp. Y2R2-4]|uniref:hypothetical protein n=1 Tax=Paucibacter sp. Y2R2-4 TaxID=2893553 RepID=UPI0021E41573|nr:hypothetical protein [Paucibacter sp. Y2R2-4]MCV2348162.1 hypothetical protein [Paucibacter sp. Y2R2-4]
MTQLITFTGGLGAQLFSAAGYFYLEQSGQAVAADLRYFDRPEHVATPGTSGQISHWGWDLDHYGLSKASFRTATAGNLVPDGPEKIRLAMCGFNEPAVVDRFKLSPAVQAQRQQLFGQDSYACLHVRRGDYVNVATYIVDDEALCRAVSKVVRLVKHLLVVSDTPLSPKMVELLSALPIEAVVAIGGEALMVHGLMRLADVLVCSNSQYSLSAAVMRDKYSLTLYPSRHDGDPASYSNAFLGSIREFQLLSRF